MRSNPINLLYEDVKTKGYLSLCIKHDTQLISHASKTDHPPLTTYLLIAHSIAAAAAQAASSTQQSIPISEVVIKVCAFFPHFF